MDKNYTISHFRQNSSSAGNHLRQSLPAAATNHTCRLCWLPPLIAAALPPPNSPPLATTAELGAPSLLNFGPPLNSWSPPSSSSLLSSESPPIPISPLSSVISAKLQVNAKLSRASPLAKHHRRPPPAQPSGNPPPAQTSVGTRQPLGTTPPAPTVTSSACLPSSGSNLGGSARTQSAAFFFFFAAQLHSAAHSSAKHQRPASLRRATTPPPDNPLAPSTTSAELVVSAELQLSTELRVSADPQLSTELGDLRQAPGERQAQPSITAGQTPEAATSCTTQR
ncbi:verprolin-like [Rosa chinensis]|uniref:verprolin-like n=1 Tax=Rosa chinensis TaxID=74649 RepID=UPI000D0976F8|nr:verprolin-like [Rosa chinensis]